MSNVWSVMVTCAGLDEGGKLFAEAMPNRCTEYAHRDYDGPLREVSGDGGGQQGWHLDVWLGSYKVVDIDELETMLREWTRVWKYKALEPGEQRFFDADLVSCFICYEEDGGSHARPVQVWPPAPTGAPCPHCRRVDPEPQPRTLTAQEACSGCNGRATTHEPCHACGAHVAPLEVHDD